jgi:hypothetical protein
VPRAPQLIADLIALAAAAGRGLGDLARDLRVDPTTLLHNRSGRRQISTRTLALIVRRYRHDLRVRDLVLHYLAAEYPLDDPDAERPIPPPALPPLVVRALAAYVERFAEESIHGGRGLYLLGADRDLAAASDYLTQLFAAQKVRTCRLIAHTKPHAADLRAAPAAARLLLVERVDFACPQVVDLLVQRTGHARPVVVTSCAPPDALRDAYLKRALLAHTHVLPIARGDEDAATAPAASPMPANA